MKKLLLFITALALTFVVNAQFKNNLWQGSPFQLTGQSGALGAGYGIQIKNSFADTTAANSSTAGGAAGFLKNIPGFIIRTVDTYWSRSNDMQKWNLLGSGTSYVVNLPLQIISGTSGNPDTIFINKAGAGDDGYLSATDWTTFNNKWGLSGNSVSPGAILGTINSRPLLFQTASTQVASISGDGLFNYIFTPSLNSLGTGHDNFIFGHQGNMSGAASYNLMGGFQAVIASGVLAGVALGRNPTVNYNYGMAVNSSTIANGQAAFAANNAQVNTFYGAGFGAFNEIATDPSLPTSQAGTNRIWFVGNGTSTITRHNAWTGLQNGNMGWGDILAPTARIHLPAGTATAGTAPIKLTTGTALSSIEDGVFEYHGSHLYFSIGSTRYQLDQQSGSGTVTGTGVANQMAYWSGTSALTGSANLTYDGALLTALSAGLGQTPTDAKGFLLTNTTAAIAGTQQYSPSIHYSGRGWKTTATAASQSVDVREYLMTVQGTTNPSGKWLIDFAVNGGSYTERFGVNSFGSIYLSGNPGSSGQVISSTGFAGTANWINISTIATTGLTNGNGTTANGTAVDWGGTTIGNVNINTKTNGNTIFIGETAYSSTSILGISANNDNGNNTRISVGGKMKEFYESAALRNTEEAVLYSYTIQAKTLTVEGMTINASYGGVFNNVVGNRRIRLYIGGRAGQLLFDSGDLDMVSSGSWTLDVTFTRSSSDGVMYRSVFTAPGLSTTLVTQVNNLLSLNFTNPYDLDLTGQSSNGAEDDVYAFIGNIYFYPKSQ